VFLNGCDLTEVFFLCPIALVNVVYLLVIATKTVPHSSSAIRDGNGGCWRKSLDMKKNRRKKRCQEA
jgi:hypothetical protein